MDTKNPVREIRRHQSEELFHLSIKILVLSVRELFLIALITRARFTAPLRFRWCQTLRG